ncbi:MAG: tripartite tricarboxylate transporter TctB family protein [Rhodobacteraceae bacterium]|nr:tripartite tricarboxylate transporter TctB family protein [Paracoccaceae bacterium]
MRAGSIGWLAVAGGTLAAALGAFLLWEGASLSVGTARRMGPGWFPVALGWLMLGLGGLLVLNGLTGRDPPPEEGDEPPLPFSALWVAAGIAAFALLVERAGLVPATFAMVALASLAAPRPRPFAVAALALGVAGLAWAVFRLGLGLPLPAFALAP